MKRFIIEQSNKEFYTSHSGLALVGLCVNRDTSLPMKAKKAFPVSKGSKGIVMIENPCDPTFSIP
jgi:hypothetical protein